LDTIEQEARTLERQTPQEEALFANNLRLVAEVRRLRHQNSDLKHAVERLAHVMSRDEPDWPD
jgi:hypothetical protein